MTDFVVLGGGAGYTQRKKSKKSKKKCRARKRANMERAREGRVLQSVQERFCVAKSTRVHSAGRARGPRVYAVAETVALAAGA